MRVSGIEGLHVIYEAEVHGLGGLYIRFGNRDHYFGPDRCPELVVHQGSRDECAQLESLGYNVKVGGGTFDE